MYATRVSVHIEPGHEDEARKGLTERVLPMVKQAPGFLAGYWFAPTGNQGSSVILWDTRQHAEAAASRLQPGSHPSPPVTVDTVDIREVIENI
ncbi:MAG TPA: antibiotic biosynthesis monooxygenase [Streptosporangiaceae bacterium]|jgi:heme-degrading monooxygenase HmoA